jgi:hypothetical protein
MKEMIENLTECQILCDGSGVTVKPFEDSQNRVRKAVRIVTIGNLKTELDHIIEPFNPLIVKLQCVIHPSKEYPESPLHFQYKVGGKRGPRRKKVSTKIQPVSSVGAVL